MPRQDPTAFPWRLAILGPSTALLFSLALGLYDSRRPRLGLALLGASFAIPMIWVVLAARDAEFSDSPLRSFVPRLTAWLTMGSAMLGIMQWNTDRLVGAMEAAFMILYMTGGIVAIRIINRRPRRPQLTAINGGNLERPQRRRSK